ncbi:MAG: AGE family epimerase/isomerase [Bacteroidota bacterium]|nr:AGE family epimerase/isomerase [Bacteroidota bacterium]
MNKFISILFSVLIGSTVVYCRGGGKSVNVTDPGAEQLKKEVKENLTGNILHYWTTRMIDNRNGGFYGRIDFKEQLYPEAEKGGILNARILWTYSSAYRVLHDTSYLRIATRARDYILKYFIDRQYGGAYRSLNYKGEPADDKKQIYTEAFFIYALSEYSRATGDKTTLAEARKIFDLVEKYALDRESNGYFEVFNRDWQRVHDRLIGENSDIVEKTMNTHLHVMEAYANLFRVSGDKFVGERLRNLVNIFLDKIIDSKRFHLICFLDRSWNPVGSIDSYGHDIESSWLLYEAAGLIGDPKLTAKVKEVSIRIADASAEGLQPDGSLLTEKDNDTGRTRETRSWWEQAETVVGNLNAYELTGAEKYFDRSVNCWNYIKKYFVDYKNGGWFSNVSEKGMPGQSDKAGFWICPYHNGRMCMEVIERLSKP